MLFSFYRLVQTCLKYDFYFILNTEGYKHHDLQMTLYPNDAPWQVTFSESNYKDLFETAIRKIKIHRKVRKE